MKMSKELERATGLVIRARRAAAFRERGAGEPRNPFQAQPGREAEFEDARQDVRAYDLLLGMLEREAKTERARANFPRKRKIIRAADKALDVFIGAGLITLATMGVAAAFVLAGFPDFTVRFALLVGVSVTLARAVLDTRK